MTITPPHPLHYLYSIAPVLFIFLTSIFSVQLRSKLAEIGPLNGGGGAASQRVEIGVPPCFLSSPIPSLSHNFLSLIGALAHYFDEQGRGSEKE